MTNQTKKTCFAEILKSNISSWQAQCWNWDDIPAFGSLVTATSHDQKIFGIIYDISTNPIDSIRQPVAYQKTEDELLKEQPQIFEFLTTSFQCLAIGYQEQNTMLYTLPPKPPKMHTFVHFASPQEYQTCFASEQFLYLLCNAQESINQEEILLAIIKHQIDQQAFVQENFNKLIETFFMVNKNNYLQTKIFLSRVQKLLESQGITTL